MYEPTLIHLIIFAITGIATGFLNVMAGGGSMLSVPMMIFLGMPGTIANGTNRLALLPQNITAVFTFYKKGFSNFKLSLSLAACTIPGAIGGAYLASQIPNANFNKLLAVIMVLILIVMMLPQPEKRKEGENISKARMIAGHICMVFIGFWGGFIQLGVGFLLMPTLNRVLRLDLITTNMHKVFIVMCYTAVAIAVFSSQIQLIWQAGLALAVGTSIGAWLATNFQIKQGIGAIKWVVNVIIIVFIIKLLFFS